MPTRCKECQRIYSLARDRQRRRGLTPEQRNQRREYDRERRRRERERQQLIKQRIEQDSARRERLCFMQRQREAKKRNLEAYKQAEKEESMSDNAIRLKPGTNEVEDTLELQRALTRALVLMYNTWHCTMCGARHPKGLSHSEALARQTKEN